MADIARRLNQQSAREKIPGKRIGITRDEFSARELAEAISRQGGTLLPLPVMRVIPAGDRSQQEATISQLDDYAWILFTSGNGVRAFRDLLAIRQATLPGTVKIGAIGAGTTRAVERHFNCRPEFVPQVATGGEMADEFIRKHSPGCGTILIPTAEERQTRAEERLREAGLTVETLVVYNTVPQSLSADDTELSSLDALVFTSPKTVRFFLEQAVIPAGCAVVAIGPTTAAYLAERGIFPVYQAFSPDTDGIMEVLNVSFT